MRIKNERGSFTIEAILSLSLFMFGFMSIISLATIAKVESTTQYAIDQVAKEVAQYYYIAEKVGIANTSNTDGVKEIGYSAFRNCTSLSQIVLPDSVEDISWFTFSGCKNLVSITLSENITEIGTGTFWRCSNLSRIVIPRKVWSIAADAFRYCSPLLDIVFHEDSAYAEVDPQIFLSKEYLAQKRQEDFCHYGISRGF